MKRGGKPALERICFMKRRVVVTGLGAVTPIGNTVEEFWAGIKEGKVGIGPITKFDASEFKVQIAAEVKRICREGAHGL